MATTRCDDSDLPSVEGGAISGSKDAAQQEVLGEDLTPEGDGSNVSSVVVEPPIRMEVIDIDGICGVY